jgi:hypothetical protein
MLLLKGKTSFAVRCIRAGPERRNNEEELLSWSVEKFSTVIAAHRRA